MQNFAQASQDFYLGFIDAKETEITVDENTRMDVLISHWTGDSGVRDRERTGEIMRLSHEMEAALSALDAGGFRPCGVRLSWDADNLMLGAIFTAAALLTVTRSVDVIRWCLFWTYLAVMVLLATDNFTLDGRASSAHGPSGCSSSHQR